MFSQEQIEAFSGQGFEITADGVLTSYTGPGGDVVIPAGVIEIAPQAFDGCEHLQSVVIPEGVTKVGWDAFSSCSSLSSVVIPASVETIESKAFAGCQNLAAVFCSPAQWRKLSASEGFIADGVRCYSLLRGGEDLPIFTRALTIRDPGLGQHQYVNPSLCRWNLFSNQKPEAELLRKMIPPAAARRVMEWMFPMLWFGMVLAHQRTHLRSDDSSLRSFVLPLDCWFQIMNFTVHESNGIQSTTVPLIEFARAAAHNKESLLHLAI